MFAGLLAKVAFSAFGKQITVKTILLAVLGILVAIGVFFAVRFVNQHFQHIKDLETQNAQLIQDKAVLTTQRDLAIQTNQDNEKARKTAEAALQSAQNIAAEEHQAAQDRTTHYKETSNAIRNAPDSTAPVPAVVTLTLDSLWGPAPGNGQPSHR